MGNTSNEGSGMYNWSSSPSVTNCTFNNNTATDGGGMANKYNSSPQITNCSFHGNTAANGGGIYNYNGVHNSSQSPKLVNCSFSWNSASSQGGGIYNGSVHSSAITSPELTSCIVWGNSTEIESFGSGTTVTVDYSIVLGGHPGTNNLNVDPLFVDAAGGDLSLERCSPAIDNGNAGVNATTEDLAGNPRRVNATNTSYFDLIDRGAFEYQETMNRIYVDKNATGANNGDSWADAFNDLQDALAFASSCKTINVIWVAAGAYYPTSGTDRSVSFVLESGIMIYGGFVSGDTTLLQRDWVNNITVLSGDIGVQGDNTDNSFQVVFYESTIFGFKGGVDGFTVTGGYADGGGNEVSGGGMYILGNGFLVANCIFKMNYAKDFGGGIYGTGSNIRIINSSIINNTAASGGGIYVNASFFYGKPQIINSSFYGNNASTGGGMYSNNSSPGVINSIFWGNGTEIENSGSNIPDVTYSIVEGGYSGTGNINADPLFVNAAAGDLHLLPGSPAIDAGTVTSAPTTDYDGESRPQGNGYDIGFDEWVANLPPNCTALTDPLNDSTNVDVDTNLTWAAATGGPVGYRLTVGRFRFLKCFLLR